MKINKSILKGSVVLLVAFNLYNIFNFVFHISMARMLNVVDYGILASLFTIIYMLAVFGESIQIVITKYSSKENKLGRLKNILKKSSRKAFMFSIIAFCFYLIVAVPLSILLNIKYLLVALNGFVIFGIFFTPLTRGVLQGKKRFGALGMNMIVEAVSKLVLAIVLVYIGWKVYGAILGTVIGMGIAILFSFISLKDVVKAKEEKAKTEGIYGYGKPAFLIMLVILVFYSIDIIIAKIFFPAEIAGIYAIASILSKTIFLGTQPISRAMFPITAEDQENKKKPTNAFMNSFWFLAAVIFVALIVFYIAPGLIVRIFSGRYIPEASKILFYLGVAASLLSFANLILLYKLSLGKIKNYYYLLLFLGIEIFLLSYFSNNLFQFSIAFVTSSAIFLWGSIFLLSD